MNEDDVFLAASPSFKRLFINAIFGIIQSIQAQSKLKTYKCIIKGENRQPDENYGNYPGPDITK